MKIGLHVCGGNAYRKRAYFTRYQDLCEAFRVAPVGQLSLEHCTLEHCTLDYNMMTLWGGLRFQS